MVLVGAADTVIPFLINNDDDDDDDDIPIIACTPLRKEVEAAGLNNFCNMMIPYFLYKY